MVEREGASMIRAGRVKAWLEAHPWLDCFTLRLVSDAGGRYYAATEIVDGSFKYEPVEEGAMVEPVLKLGAGEIDALLEALKQHAKPVDATVDALRDTREVRDRLLSMIEKRGLR